MCIVKLIDKATGEEVVSTKFKSPDKAYGLIKFYQTWLSKKLVDIVVLPEQKSKRKNIIKK